MLKILRNIPAYFLLLFHSDIFTFFYIPLNVFNAILTFEA